MATKLKKLSLIKMGIRNKYYQCNFCKCILFLPSGMINGTVQGSCRCTEWYFKYINGNVRYKKLEDIEPIIPPKNDIMFSGWIEPEKFNLFFNKNDISFREAQMKLIYRKDKKKESEG